MPTSGCSRRKIEGVISKRRSENAQDKTVEAARKRYTLVATLTIYNVAHRLDFETHLAFHL